MNQDDITFIKLPYPNQDNLQLKLDVATCYLVIAPGIANNWVTGRHNDPRGIAPLNITQSGNVTRMVSRGAFAYRTRPKFFPDMRISFGRLHTFSLSILTGDLKNQLDFGGIPLSSLEIQFGSESQIVDFSYPTPHTMEHLKIRADNGPVRIENLANANAAEIHLTGDSTIYQLNFAGEIKVNTELRIGAFVSSTEILVPAGTSVKIISGNFAAGREADDFTPSAQGLLNTPAREGREPLLTIYYPGGLNPLKVKYA